MALDTLTPKTWDGQTLNDATYESTLHMTKSHAGDRAEAQTIETDLPGDAPVYVRFDVKQRILILHVRVKTALKSDHDQLKKWFSPAGGQRYFVVTDGDTIDRRLYAYPERMMRNGETYDIQLEASNPFWESATANAPAATNIDSSGETFALTNAGDYKARPSFTITPKTVKVHGNDYVRRQRAIIANRSPLAISDPVGDGWPVNIVGTVLDTDALNTASKLQTDLDDLRVYLEGALINRWPDPATDNASTRVWCNLNLPPRKTLTLPAAASNVSPANGAVITVTNPQGTIGWPSRGFLFWEDEVIHYVSKTFSTITLASGDGRGALGSTAASHSASLTGYWIAHPSLALIYDNTAVTNPNPPDDRKPAIDLTNSTNSSFKWASVFNQTGRRSACWQPLFTDEGNTALYIRCYDSSNTVIFEDAAPVAGKPNFNNLVMDSPYGIKAAAAAITLDETVGIGLHLRGYLTDMSGYESRLISQMYTAALTGQTFQPASVASRLRLNARNAQVIGNRSGATASGAFDAFFTLDESTTIYGFAFKCTGTNPSSSVTIIIREPAATTPSISLNSYVSVNPLIGNGVTAEVVVPLTTEIVLPAGNYRIHVNPSGLTLFYNAMRTAPRLRGLEADASEGTVTGVNYYASPWLSILSDVTEGQEDAPSLSGDLITLDNIILNWDDATPQTPKILLGAEEAASFYYANFTLKNNTTGDYVSVLYPMVKDQTVTIDCANRRITDDQTGEEIPFALVASNPDDWLPMNPGSNTFVYTETGVVSVDVAPSWRDAWS